MEILTSKLSPKTYMAALRSCCRFPLAMFCSERVVGIAIYRFFSVAYYAPREWNRRISGECNRAIGYVKKADDGCEIHFIRSSGMFSPLWLIFWTLVGALYFNVELEMIYPFSWLICLIFSVVICGISAVRDSLTDAGQEGIVIISDLLQEPNEFYYC